MTYYSLEVEFSGYVFEYSNGLSERRGLGVKTFILGPSHINSKIYRTALARAVIAAPAMHIVGYLNAIGERDTSFNPNDSHRWFVEPKELVMLYESIATGVLAEQLVKHGINVISRLTDQAVKVCHDAEMHLQDERRKAQVKPESHYGAGSRRGYVYLIQSSTGAYKIGRTTNPADRLATFGVKLPFEVEYVCVITAQDMYQLERKLHKHFHEKRLNGEWFALDMNDVDYIKALAGVAQS